MARNIIHGDLIGRVVAVLVLSAGIAALAFVFVLAVHLFESPVPGLGLPVPAGGTPPSAANIGVSLALLFRQLAILAVMILAGSLLASNGVRLYLGSIIPHHPVHVSSEAAGPVPAAVSPTEQKTAGQTESAKP